MGFWNRNRGGESAAESPVADTGNAWQEMAATVTLEREQAEKAQRSLERQQRKIIGYFVNGSEDRYLVVPDVEVDAGTRLDFIREIGNGKITKRDEEAMLMRLRGPIDRPERGMGAGAIFEKVAQDPWQLQLLSLATGDGLREGDVGTGASAVARLVNYQTPEADFRTPVGFAQKREEMLGYIRPQVDQVTYEKYEESMDALEKNLYGKRFEYYQAFEGLRDEAEELRKSEAPTERLVRRQETYRLGEEQRRELLRRAQVDGDWWYEQGVNYQLTPTILEAEGLGPNYVTNVEGREIALSDIFELPGGRSAVEAYIPTEDGVKVRSYYRSNSQGVWRYLPDYIRDVQGGGSIKWYGKGRGEESLTLPYELQESLATIEASAGRRPSNTLSANPYFLFAGAAKAYNSKEEYQQCLAAGQMRGDYYREVAAVPQNTEFGAIELSKQRPETVVASYGSSPDFEQVEGRYASNSALAGATQTEVFRSKDGKKNWLFCMDSQGRSYVGGIEVNSPITSTGLRQEWMHGGDMVTPLYEYESQTDGYGDPEDAKRNYRGMWKYYLSRVPVIREYVEGRGRGL